MFRSLRIIFAAILLLGVALMAAGTEDQKKPQPLTEGEVIRLLLGGVAPERVEELARERGVSFEVTAAVERDLRDAGATDALLETLRHVAPKPVTPPPEPPPPAPAAVLIVESTPGGAQVFVDDELVARTSSEGRLRISTLAPGPHRVRLALEGYRDFEQAIDLAAGGPLTVKAALEAAQAAAPPPPKVDPTLSRRAPKAYFGVMIQNLTPETAQTYKVPDTFGALVQQVDPRGPAAAAGLMIGDVVRSFKGEPLKSADELKALVGAQDPGSEVGLEVLRNGNIQIVVVKLVPVPADLSKSVHVDQGALRGLTFVELTDLWRKTLALPEKTRGVIVNEVEPDTLAAQAGLVAGDVIVEVNRSKVSSLADIPALAARAGGPTVLLVNHQGKEMFVKFATKP